MRKYVIGFIGGLIIGFSATAYADDIQSLIGKQVEGETAVYLNGQPLDTAIIVQGKSYMPTRSISESSGKTVIYNQDAIYLMSTPEPTLEPEIMIESTPTPTPEVKPVNQLQEAKRNLRTISLQIARLQNEKYYHPERAAEIDAQIDALNTQAEPIQDQIKALEAQ